MKTKVLFPGIFFIFFNFVLSAQKPNLVNPQILKTELDTISANKYQIKSIATDIYGNWVVLFGKSGYSYIKTSKEAAAVLDTLANNALEFIDIDFFPDNKTIILFQKNAFYADSVQAEFKQIVANANQSGNIFKCADIKQNKQVFVYGQNAFYHKNAPEMFVTRMRALQNRNQNIKNVALSDSNAWIILYAKKGMIFQYLPEDMNKQIIELAKKDVSIDKAFFLKDKWVIVYDNYKYLSNL